MSFSTCSAGAFSGPDFCFIFAPCGYDEPEILPSCKTSVFLMGPDGEQGEILYFVKPVADTIGLRGRELYATVKSGVKAGSSRPRQIPSFDRRACPTTSPR